MRRTTEKIAQEVERQLAWDNRVDGSDITFSVENGRVILRGTVPGLLAREAAAATVWSVEGVEVVENRLRVAEEDPPGDAELFGAVLQTLAWNRVLKAAEIEVTVNDGEVILEGWVDTLWKRGYAATVVRSLRGVTAVDNQLRISPDEVPGDRTLQHRVEEAIDRSWAVDGDVVVEAHDGEVELKGEVASWMAYRAAHEAALYSDGVRRIRNTIVVAPG